MTVTIRRLRTVLAGASVATLLFVVSAPVAADQPTSPPTSAAQFVVRGPQRSGETRQPDRLIVKYRDSASTADRVRSRRVAGVGLGRQLRGLKAEVVRPRGRGLAAAAAALSADPAVEYVEPDAYLDLAGDPTDEPLYVWQWGLENNGTHRYSGDVPHVSDVDVDASGAWPTATGSGVTVAVLDDGVDFSNDELAGQEWTNPGESGGGKETNGVDDDGNGYVDDVHGVNLCGDASDQTLHVPGVDFHGTAVSSVLGASASGSGITGVAPDVDVMAVRWLEEERGDCASNSVAAEAVEYAVANGADVINASWGGTTYSQLLFDAIADASEAGVLFVAASGNAGSSTEFYPAAYDLPNILSVGAIQANGYLASFSNWGSWVDIAAPGKYILAPFADTTDYYFWDGTSFAAPHATGVAALVAQAHPELLGNAPGLRSRLILSGWRDSLTTAKTASGRVLDAAYALDFAAPTPPTFIGAAPRTGQTLGATTVLTRLTWSGAADPNGIDSYRVRYRKVGTTTWTTITSATTNTYVDRTLALGTQYEIEVAARDRGSNLAASILTLKPTRYQESTSLATYHGTWKTSSSSSHSGGRARYATSSRAYVQFALNARSVALVMPRGPSRGSARIYVDGSYVKTISLYSSTTKYRQVTFARNWGGVGAHTIRIAVVGTAGHPRVDIDALIAGK